MKSWLTNFAPARIATITGIAGLLVLGASSSSPTLAGANITPVVYYACVNHSTHAFQYSTATATCPTGYVKENWNQSGPAGPKGATGATGATGPQGPTGPQRPSGFSQIQHGGSGGTGQNSAAQFGFVVAPVTVLISSSTEAAITSTGEFGSSVGNAAVSHVAVCYAQSGTSLVPLTDVMAVVTDGVMPVTISGALIPNGTWLVGLCSQFDSAGVWNNGSTTVVIGNYVSPGFQAPKVQPLVRTNPMSKKP